MTTYPDPLYEAIPTVYFTTPIFHPNVISFDPIEKKAWTCIYGTNMTENQPVNLLVLRLITMIQYANTDFGSPANHSAKNWYDRNKHKGWFPIEKKLSNEPPENQKVKFRGKKT